MIELRSDPGRDHTLEASHKTMSEPDNAYVEHARRATELLTRSVDIHVKELVGEISRDEAINTVVRLNEQASAEMNLALAALENELDSNNT